MLRLRNEMLCVAPQNLVEFRAVATRPLNENGLGMAVAKVAGEIAVIRQLFRVLPYTAEVPGEMAKHCDHAGCGWQANA